MKNRISTVPHSAFSIQHSEKGFTLVEMAIILVVIGLLIGIGAGLVGIISRNIKHAESREIVDSAVESVISYAARNDFLPTSGTFPTVVRNPKDAFATDLTYVSDSALTGSGTICGKKKVTQLSPSPPSPNVFTDASSGSSVTVENVAFMVVSSGENRALNTSTTAPITIYTQGYDLGGGAYYDDLARYVTLFELKSKIKCD